MKIFRRIIRLLVAVIVLVALYIGGVILYGTLTDYKRAPESSEREVIRGQGLPPAQIDTTINLLTWNLGYGGLGKEEDFFYDGGKTVRAPRNIWDKDFRGQLHTLLSNDSIDFYLIQEIDRNSHRSYEVDQFDSVLHTLSGYDGAFAMNYDVKFVPVPYFRPMGKVSGGIAIFSKYQPDSAVRYQYPGHFPWPTRIFFLDRCFLAEHYPLANGKELVLIDTHNSAYDESGKVKDQEMAFLKQYITAEYAKGNYVIAGGDWNQCPPSFNNKTFLADSSYHDFIPPSMSFDYLPEGWLWCYDPYHPTNRDVSTPLDVYTFKTIIDFYLISPNIRLLNIHAIDNGFDFSDHQPVVMKIVLLS